MNFLKIATTLIRWWRKLIGWPGTRCAMVCAVLCSTAVAADPIVVTTDGPATVTVTPGEATVSVAPTQVSVSPIAPDHSRPLPVFASWNIGKNQTADGQDVGYTPDWQHEQAMSGVPIMFTFEHSFWLDNTHRTSSAVEFNPAWPHVRDNRLPIAFIGWNFMDRLRLGQWPGSTALPADHPFLVKADGTVIKNCSPWSPHIHHWYAEGRRVGLHLAATYAADYPEPPAIYLFDNHEAGIATLEQAQLDKRRPALINAIWGQYWQTKPEYAREVERVEMDRAYALRYAEFKRGMRDALPGGWKKIKFISYAQFGNEFGITEFTPDSMRYAVPWADAGGGGVYTTHDGMAANVGYLHNWYSGNVGLLRSPSTEAGNVRFAIDTMREVNPAYEVVSLYWNGKAVTPQQYLGMCRCVMWQTQTPIQMAWVGSAQTRAETFVNQIQPLMQAVQEVHTHETLKRFWRDGKLLRNLWTRDFTAWPKVNPQWDSETGYGHPYAYMMPPEYADTGKRLFLQHVPINNRHVKWSQLGGPDDRFVDVWKDDRERDVAVPVFAICHQLGDEYLIYAHAPNGARGFVEIDVHATTARTFRIVVDVPIEGAFFLRKANGDVEQVN